MQTTSQSVHVSCSALTLHTASNKEVLGFFYQACEPEKKKEQWTPACVVVSPLLCVHAPTVRFVVQWIARLYMCVLFINAYFFLNVCVCVCVPAGKIPASPYEYGSLGTFLDTL